MNYSTEQLGHLIALIGFILAIFKVNIANEEISAVVYGVLTVGGILYSWYRRWKKGDITIGGFRK